MEKTRYSSTRNILAFAAAGGLLMNTVGCSSEQDAAPGLSTEPTPTVTSEFVVPSAVATGASVYPTRTPEMPVARKDALNDQMSRILLQLCDLRRADLQGAARYGAQHGNEILQLEQEYTWYYVELHGLQGQKNDGNQYPNYARTAQIAECPDAISKPVG